MLRHVLHLDLDAFFISVERLFDSRLCGIPLLVGGNTDRGVVAACSYEARKFGVHSAMPIKRAKQLCPSAVIVRGDYERYTYYSRMVTDIVAECVPTYEKASIDEFYIDLTGMDRFFGCFRFSGELKQRILRETGLTVSYGLSANKLVSKVATGQVKPNGAWQVPHGNESCFLAPLTIDKIPMIGQKTASILRAMGVSKVATLQDISPELLCATFGKNGRTLWERAHGIDTSPVEQYNERKSVSAEQTFEQDISDMHLLKAHLAALSESLCAKLRNEQWLTSQIAVKIRYADFNTYTKQLQVPYSAADHQLWPRIYALFEQLYNKRLRIRLIGVRFSGLVHGNEQIALFDRSVMHNSLYLTLDKLNNRFGKRTVRRANSFV